MLLPRHWQCLNLPKSVIESNEERRRHQKSISVRKHEKYTFSPDRESSLLAVVSAYFSHIKESTFVQDETKWSQLLPSWHLAGKCPWWASGCGRCPKRLRRTRSTMYEAVRASSSHTELTSSFRLSRWDIVYLTGHTTTRTKRRPVRVFAGQSRKDLSSGRRSSSPLSCGTTTTERSMP